MLAYHQRLCSVKYVSLYGCTIHLFGCSLKCVLGWWFMVFNATFNNIPVISWQLVLLVEETGVPEKTTDLSQVTDKLYHHNVISSTPRHERGSNTHLWW